MSPDKNSSNFREALHQFVPPLPSLLSLCPLAQFFHPSPFSLPLFLSLSLSPSLPLSLSPSLPLSLSPSLPLSLSPSLPLSLSPSLPLSLSPSLPLSLSPSLPLSLSLHCTQFSLPISLLLSLLLWLIFFFSLSQVCSPLCTLFWGFFE